jgi:GINS complex subunit 2
MAVKKNLVERSLTTKEVAFLAEQELIFILPRYSMNGIELVGRNMKKLKALQRVQVPFWLALLLKKQNKCNIVIPEWLSVPYLKNKYSEEQKIKDRVCELPWHWIPTSKILLDICPDDFIDSPHELRSLIQDLREIRMLKTRQGFAMIDDEYLELTGLSLMEINEVRPFLLQTMDTLRDLRKVTLSDDEDEQNEADYDNSLFETRNNEDSNDYSGNYNDKHNNDNSNSIQPDVSHMESNFSELLGDSRMFNTSINTSINDTTLVDPTVQTTKRRRVDHRNTRTSHLNDNNNNNNADSDSDSDVEYRH